MAQPTPRRENRFNTTGTNNKLSWVQVYVKSATHIWFGGERREVAVEEIRSNQMQCVLAEVSGRARRRARVRRAAQA
jgi:hypothetical protein